MESKKGSKAVVAGAIGLALLVGIGIGFVMRGEQGQGQEQEQGQGNKVAVSAMFEPSNQNHDFC